MRTARIGMARHTTTLAGMRECREAMVKLLTANNARRGVHGEAQWLLADIDDLSSILTGNRELFHLKGHG